MGQIVRSKKRGRPAKSDPASPARENDLRRSHRRRNVKYVFDLDDYFDDEGIFEDDEERQRREKKLKLLLLKDENESTPRRAGHAPSQSSDSSSSSGGGGNRSRKRKSYDEIEQEEVDDENDDEYNYNDGDDEVKESKQESKPEHSPPGTPVEDSTGLPLPDKKALELILDKLQKKDIYGVYAEPVDPEELPDYHDVVENPMDFATVRNKLSNGLYATMEQFESDVFLICSNAMLYNSSDTIYHKQARSIQELAKKKFYKIRLNIDRSEKEIKPEQKLNIERSGKEIKPEQKMKLNPNFNKQIKNSVSRTTMQEPVVSDISSGPPPTIKGDTQNVSNVQQVIGFEKSGNIEGLVEENSLLNDKYIEKGEESLAGRGSQSRSGKKLPAHDENRRASYYTSLADPVTTSKSIFCTFDGESKELVPVGVYSDHSYGRSLARFAATLGSIPWKIASNRIEQALPQELKFGRGWVGEYEPLPAPAIFLKNCRVKEPDFLAKVKQTVISVPSKVVSPGNGVPFLEKKIPFLKTQQNVPDMKPSFFLAPGNKPSAPANPTYQRQNSQQFKKVEKKVSKQAELICGPPSFNKNPADFKALESEASRPMLNSRNINFSPRGTVKQPDINGFATGELPNGKNLNRLDNNTIASSSSDFAKGPPVCYPHEQGQGLSDPVQLMRMLSEKGQNQQKNSSNQTTRNLTSGPSKEDLNQAATAASRAWMSVGAGGFIRPVVENTNPYKNQIINADSLYNSTREMQQQISRFPESNNFPVNFVPSTRELRPVIRAGNEMQFRNHQQPMVFPPADLSRFQVQSNSWRNISPQMHARQRQESLPPDLNIGFQSSGSPGRPNPTVMVDSQQPDLALQL